MSVKIRLKKLGRRHRPFFQGLCHGYAEHVEMVAKLRVLGTYDPMVPETDARAMLNGERIDYWLSVGAKPTPKVDTLIKKYGYQRYAPRRPESSFGKTRCAKRAASITAAVSEAEETKLEAKAGRSSDRSNCSPTEAAETTEATAEAMPKPLLS